LDALILAAGRGTRLGSIGEGSPKALIEVSGRTMLEHVASGLVRAGVDRIVVNVHHHAEQIERFVAGTDLGAEVLLSHERERPLETGGGLLHARDLLRGDAPFFLHNVDVITDADLGGLYAAHLAAASGRAGPDGSTPGRLGPPLATLAVSDRTTSRHLLFDDVGLYGWENTRAEVIRKEARPPEGRNRERWAFAGIHVISPQLLGRILETGVFSIIDVYMRLAGEGARIAPASIGDARWLEIGNPERLAAAREALTREPLAR